MNSDKTLRTPHILEYFPSAADGSMEEETIAALSREILRHLKIHGFAYVQQPISEGCFEAISTRMGKVGMRTDLIINPENDQMLRKSRETEASDERPSVYNPGALVFHTDRPRVNVLGWYCIEQDTVGGALRLIDTKDLPTHFSKNELDTMSEIQVRYTIRSTETNKEEFFFEPLVSKHKKEYYHVYYASWHLPSSLTQEKADLIKRFEDYVKFKDQNDAVDIRINKQGCLFINNNRMLHGRNEISKDSKRHLIRLFINVPNKAI